MIIHGSMLFLLAILEYIDGLQTYITVTRLRVDKGNPQPCTDKLLDSSSEQYKNLNTDMCNTLTHAISQSEFLSIDFCEIYAVTCEGRLPMVSTRVDIKSSKEGVSTRELHQAFNLEALIKETVVTVDYLQIKDFNECTAYTHSCGSNAVCKNTMGSYQCSCKRGYSDSSAKHKLESGQICDVNCGATSCLNGGRCVTIDSQPVCNCTDDYRGKACEVHRREVEWLLMLGVTSVIFTLILLPAIACLCVYLKTQRKTRRLCKKDFHSFD